MYKSAFVLNNLSIGKGQLSVRTDNIMAAKLNKLNWAIEQAEGAGGAVILSGRIFDKASSFSDLAFIINKGILSHPRVYLMPDYGSYIEGQQISDRSMLSILTSISPKKTLSNNFLEVVGDDGKVSVIGPRWQSQDIFDQCDEASRFYLFDSNKSPRERQPNERSAIIMSTHPLSSDEKDGEDRLTLKSSFRNNLEQSTACIYRVTGDCQVEVVEPPQEKHVFREEVVVSQERRRVVKESSHLTITEEFDPRNKDRKFKGNNFMSILDNMYAQSKLSKTSYEIISNMKAG